MGVLYNLSQKLHVYSINAIKYIASTYVVQHVCSFPSRCPDPPRPLAELEQIKTAIELLKQGKSPLVIVGKGNE
jgi:TPP-dependent trihydroxycyclohexane-1,2-dione (THcHDO) dehydratase